MKTRLRLAHFLPWSADRLYYTLLLMLVSISAVFAQTGTIRYVKAGGTGNGSSWASASGDLQAIINVSASGDQVWVAQGIYKPGGNANTNRSLSFTMKDKVGLYGGFVGNETALSARPAINPVSGTPGSGQPSSTTLSGDIGTVGDNSDNSYHVINNSVDVYHNTAQITATTILDGFVITGGNANSSPGDDANRSGGGIFALVGSNNNATANNMEYSPTIRNCSFLDNSAIRGGAMYNGIDALTGFLFTVKPTLINCFFQGNTASTGGAIANDADQSAATLAANENSPTLTNCSFVSNSANYGGAISNASSGTATNVSPQLTNCYFEANSVTYYGGAIYNYIGAGPLTGKSRSDYTLTNCSFLNNTASGPSNNYSRGGAIYNDARNGILYPYITNCSFQGNTASFVGGAMYSSTAASVSDRTTGDFSLRMTNCVVFGNGGVKTFDGDGGQVDATVTFSLVEASATVGWRDAGANQRISVSPFAATNTTQLRANSPAINAGDGSVQNVTTDLAGNPRIVGCRIDMGALEFQYTFLPLAINAQPASSSVACAGTAISVPVSVSGTVSGYQWYKDSFANPVAGQTSATLTLNNPQPSDAGSYSLVVTSTCNSLTSNGFALRINKLTVSISPGSATVCQGQSATLTASGASTGETLSYIWNNTFTGNPISATATGTYSVTGIDGNGCSSTASAQVTVYRPTVSISPSSVSICEGQSALLTASGVSTYTWSDNITGNTLTATTTGTYAVTGVDGNGCSNTATASVTVKSIPTVSISASPSATITQGNSVTLTAVAPETTAVTWVTGSTSSSIVVSPSTTTPYSVTAGSATGCTASASLTITATPPACSPVLYVTQTGAGLRDGSSWSNALGANQLQIAINAAANCGGNGQVWVTAGVYKPTTTTNRTISFSMRNGVAIYGGFLGTETALSDRPAINPVAGQPSSTTLSGDIGSLGTTSDNSFQVISNPASLSLTTTAVLDGFVITGGAGGTLGGGLSNDACSPTIRNCSFVSNAVLVTSGSTSRGGAMYNGNSSSPQLTNCRFEGNSISGSNGNISYGGAISNFTNSSPLLVNCIFLGNSVSGSTSNYGGAMANNINSNPQLINCSFLNNSASGGSTSRGGAINNGNACTPQLINCSFLNNSVSGGANNQGGAIANNTSSAQLTNCVLFSNGSDNTFYNVSSPTVASITATYSLFDNKVTGYTSDPTNLTASNSPFASTTSTQLASGSPAINTGSNQAYQTAGGPATDLAGNTRIQQALIDMGAYESQSSCTLPLSAGASLPQANVGVTISLTASGATSYQWYAPSSVSLTSPTNSSAVQAKLTTAGVQTFTVVASNGNCSQSMLVSVTALTGPDLSSILNLPSSSFSAGETKGLLMQVQEVNGATATGNIVVTITVPVGYSVSFDNTLTSFSVSGGSTTSVQNTQWHISSRVTGQSLSIAINGGQSVEANSTMNLGFSITRSSANSGSVSNVTVNVANDSSGSYDVNRFNNVYARIITGL